MPEQAQWLGVLYHPPTPEPGWPFAVVNGFFYWAGDGGCFRRFVMCDCDVRDDGDGGGTGLMESQLFRFVEAVSEDVLEVLWEGYGAALDRLIVALGDDDQAGYMEATVALNAALVGLVRGSMVEGLRVGLDPVKAMLRGVDLAG